MPTKRYRYTYIKSRHALLQSFAQVLIQQQQPCSYRPEPCSFARRQEQNISHVIIHQRACRAARAQKRCARRRGAQDQVAAVKARPMSHAYAPPPRSPPGAVNQPAHTTYAQPARFYFLIAHHHLRALKNVFHAVALHHPPACWRARLRAQAAPANTNITTDIAA